MPQPRLMPQVDRVLEIPQHTQPLHSRLQPSDGAQRLTNRTVAVTEGGKVTAGIVVTASVVNRQQAGAIATQRRRLRRRLAQLRAGAGLRPPQINDNERRVGFYVA